MEERAVANSSPLWGKPREGAGKLSLVSGNVVSLDAPGLTPPAGPLLPHTRTN